LLNESGGGNGMMARKWSGWAAVTIAGGFLLGACSRGPSAREQQLEKRVHELEQQRTASPSPSGWPDVVLESPRPEPAQAARPASRTASTASAPHSTAHRAPAHAQTPAGTSTSRTSTAPPPAATTASRGTTTASAPATASRPVDQIPDAEAARGDSDWPAGSSDSARETTRASEPVVVPANTQLSLRLETPVSSATSHVGDRVTARVERAVSDDGSIVLPGGTVLEGRVSQADAAGRVKGVAKVAVAFDRIVIRGQSHAIETTVISAVAPDSTARDAKIIGGSAVAGAIIGGISGGKGGAAKGAVLGAGAGTGAVLVTKGHEVEMPAGSRWTVRTRNAIRL
jgi:hypothetical protein